jgi:hypothetical protein
VVIVHLTLLGTGAAGRVVQLEIDVVVLRRRGSSGVGERRLQGVRCLPVGLRVGGLGHLSNTVKVAMLRATGLLYTSRVGLAISLGRD